MSSALLHTVKPKTVPLTQRFTYTLIGQLLPQCPAGRTDCCYSAYQPVFLQLTRVLSRPLAGWLPDALRPQAVLVCVAGRLTQQGGYFWCVLGEGARESGFGR